MRTHAGSSYSFLRPPFVFGMTILALWMSAGCQPSATTPASESKEGIEEPLSSFQQVLTSSTTKLALAPAQEIRIPVRIENPGTESWVGVGKYPVTVSYKWYQNGNMLPIEGERTVFPGVIGPHGAANVDVRVVAPDKPGNYVVRVTLVQEGVAWFLLKSNTYLELPAVVK
jgi:hypothetical protein